MFNEIVPGLYVGDQESALYPEVENFSCVINVTHEAVFSKLHIRNDIIKKRFAMYDDGDPFDQNLALYFMPRACILIANQLALHRRVLVYCVEGKQRSVTIICAWLISSGMSLQDAQQKLIVKHKLSFDCSNHVYFYKALKTWENRVCGIE